MFIEPTLHNIQPKPRFGWIEVVCGSMFSGKTEELIRRVNRATIAKQKVKIFKPTIDTRYHKEKVVSHNRNMLNSICVADSSEILAKVTDCDVVAIDEAQFMDRGLADVCVALANKGHRVIICGLDMDYMGKPFGAIPNLMSAAEFVTKLHAICMQCGDVASYSYRLTDSDKKVLLGEKNDYEARCRKCFVEGMNQKEHHLSNKKVESEN